MYFRGVSFDLCPPAMPSKPLPLRFTKALSFLFFLALTPAVKSQGTSWSLERAIAHAQANNLQVRQGQLGLEGNDIDVDEAKAAFLPNLNGSASHGYNWAKPLTPSPTNLPPPEFDPIRWALDRESPFLPACPTTSGWNRPKSAESRRA